MKQVLFVLGVCVVAIGLVTEAKAQNYPWCAVYDTGAAPLNCGFVSFEQCMATVRGIGGFCQRNDWYRPPSGPHAPTR
jgi:Protein of unknown function (DUF3551)